MKRLRWQLLVVMLALAAIAALLVSQQTEQLPGIAQSNSTAEPKTGGVYTEAMIGSLGRLNPVLDFNNPADRDIDRLLFSGLVRFDDRGLPVGDLAESWGISQDGKVYNFSIQPNAIWHDGEPVTSDDIVFSIELMRDEQSVAPDDLKELWKQVELKVLDEKTLQFRLPEPFAPFLDYLAFGVLPKHLLQGVSAANLADDEFNLKPVGSGPFRFERMLGKDGQVSGVVLSAFKDYYGKKPYLEQVAFRYFPDAASALAAYRSGEVLGISQVTPEVLPEALKLPTLALYTGRVPRMRMVYFNLDNAQVGFFQDTAVRRALMTGLNRQWIVDRLMNGQSIIADGPILPGTWAYYDGVEHISYDPQQAVEMLKDAGYTIPAQGGNVRAKDGKALEFELVFPDEPDYSAQAQVIQDNWQKLGVKVNLKPVGFDELMEKYLNPRTYQAALVELDLSKSPDPDPYPFWHQAQITGGQNYAKWDDRQASEYLEQARVEVDLNERIKRYRNFQVRFSAELPALPLYYSVYSFAVDRRVVGVSMGPLFDSSDRLNTITAWSLVQGAAPPTPIPSSGTAPAPEMTATP